MKRLLPLLLLSLLLLAGCAGEKELRGEVIQSFSMQDTDNISFILENAENEKVGFLLNEQTVIHSLIDGVDGTVFKENPPENIFISVSFNDEQKSTFAINKEKIPVYTADFIIIEQILSDKIVLADGSTINVWQGLDEMRYKTEDGTEILIEYRPENYEYIVQDCALEEEIKESIIQYYEKQGTYYEITDELAKAYAAYQNIKSDFDSYTVSQRTDKTAENENIVYFATNIHLPLNGSVGTEVHLGAAFDRRNGSIINNWDLFQVSEDEVLQVIFANAKITGKLQKEIKSAIKGEYLLFYPDRLEIAFPKGVLPSQEHSFSIILEYEQSLIDIMQKRALPER